MTLGFELGEVVGSRVTVLNSYLIESEHSIPSGSGRAKTTAFLTVVVTSQMLTVETSRSDNSKPLGMTINVKSCGKLDTPIMPAEKLFSDNFVGPVFTMLYVYRILIEQSSVSSLRNISLQSVPSVTVSQVVINVISQSEVGLNEGHVKGEKVGVRDGDMFGRRLIEGISDGNIDGSSLTTSLGESDGTTLGSSVSIRLGNCDGIDDDLIDGSGLGKAEGYAVGTLDGMELGISVEKVLGALDGTNVGCSEELSDGTSLWNNIDKDDGVLLSNLDG